MNSMAGNLPELHTKPDFEMAVQRIYAWYAQAVIDRPPIRFTAHNADLELRELEPFIEAMRPEGVLLCLAVDPQLQPGVIKRVEKW